MQPAPDAPRDTMRPPVAPHIVSPILADGWRGQAFGVLRIVFGCIWVIDAAFKWQPAFQTGFVTYLTGALDGQPAMVKAWIGVLDRHRQGRSARLRAHRRCQRNGPRNRPHPRSTQQSRRSRRRSAGTGDLVDRRGVRRSLSSRIDRHRRRDHLLPCLHRVCSCRSQVFTSASTDASLLRSVDGVGSHPAQSGADGAHIRMTPEARKPGREFGLLVLEDEAIIAMGRRPVSTATVEQRR